MRFEIFLGWGVVEVTGTYVPPSRGARDSLGGIAGAGPALEPDEPPDFEIDTVKDMHGKEVEVNDDDLEKIINLGVKIAEDRSCYRND